MESLSFIEGLKARESCRSYAQIPVEKEKIEALIELACMAPSAGNGQPWRFVAVSEEETKQALAKMTHTRHINGWVDQAPCILAIAEVIDERMVKRYGELYLEKQWTTLDIGLCTQQLSLAATALGLGSCIIGYFPEEEAKALLHIPQKDRLRLMVTLGYPKETTVPRVKKRLPTEEVLRFID
ncbi:MAG: NAD(P)H nitroreductase [Clostridiales bacterium]|nr:NAD(P)H nitroreductase [Clostridiales bacterium]